MNYFTYPQPPPKISESFIAQQHLKIEWVSKTWYIFKTKTKNYLSLGIEDSKGRGFPLDLFPRTGAQPSNIADSSSRAGPGRLLYLHTKLACFITQWTGSNRASIPHKLHFQIASRSLVYCAEYKVSDLYLKCSQNLHTMVFTLHDFYSRRGYTKCRLKSM